MFLQQTVVIPQVAGLYGAGRRIVFRVKKQDYFFAGEIAQRNRFTVLVPAFECGAFCPSVSCVAMLFIGLAFSCLLVKTDYE